MFQGEGIRGFFASAAAKQIGGGIHLAVDQDRLQEQKGCHWAVLGL